MKKIKDCFKGQSVVVCVKVFNILKKEYARFFFEFFDDSNNLIKISTNIFWIKVERAGAGAVTTPLSRDQRAARARCDGVTTPCRG